MGCGPSSSGIKDEFLSTHQPDISNLIHNPYWNPIEYQDISTNIDQLVSQDQEHINQDNINQDQIKSEIPNDECKADGNPENPQIKQLEIKYQNQIQELNRQLSYFKSHAATQVDTITKLGTALSLYRRELELSHSEALARETQILEAKYESINQDMLKNHNEDMLRLRESLTRSHAEDLVLWQQQLENHTKELERKKSLEIENEKLELQRANSILISEFNQKVQCFLHDLELAHHSEVKTLQGQLIEVIAQTEKEKQSWSREELHETKILQMKEEHSQTIRELQFEMEKYVQCLETQQELAYRKKCQEMKESFEFDLLSLKQQQEWSYNEQLKSEETMRRLLEQAQEMHLLKLAQQEHRWKESFQALEMKHQEEMNMKDEEHRQSLISFQLKKQEEIHEMEKKIGIQLLVIEKLKIQSQNLNSPSPSPSPSTSPSLPLSSI